ncbi:MAG: P-II family nitrogen regulator [Lachnospiraceae bacterium]
MKKLEIIIRPDKLEGLKELLAKNKCQGMTVFNVMGCGKQLGFANDFALTNTVVNLIPKLYVITVTQDELLEDILNDITAVIGTGTAGDGKIFVSTVEETVRIRTGERGINAL